jgi:hypothetical protein
MPNTNMKTLGIAVIVFSVLQFALIYLIFFGYYQFCTSLGNCVTSLYAYYQLPNHENSMLFVQGLIIISGISLAFGIIAGSTLIKIPKQ